MNSPKLEAPDNDVLGARMMDSRTKEGEQNKTALATHPFAFPSQIIIVDHYQFLPLDRPEGSSGD